MGNHEAAGGYPQNAGVLVVLVIKLVWAVEVYPGEYDLWFNSSPPSAAYMRQ